MREETFALTPLSAEINKARKLAWRRKRDARNRARDYRKYLVDQARGRARRNGVPFDLRPEDITIPAVCPVLGIPLRMGVSTGSGRNHHAPSLDRIVPERGYVRGNVIVVSYRANVIKHNATPDELLKIAAFYSRYKETRNDRPKPPCIAGGKHSKH